MFQRLFFTSTEKQLSASQKLVVQLQNELLATEGKKVLSGSEDNQLIELQMVEHFLSDRVIFCEKHIGSLNEEIRTHIQLNESLNVRIDLLQSGIADRIRMNDHLSLYNSELERIIRDSRLLRCETDSGSSRVLSVGPSSGEVSIVNEDSLAREFIDVRLSEQQQQNHRLLEQLGHIRNELTTAKDQLAASEARAKKCHCVQNTNKIDRLEPTDQVFGVSNDPIIDALLGDKSELDVLQERARSLQIIEYLAHLKTEYMSLITDTETEHCQIELLHNSPLSRNEKYIHAVRSDLKEVRLIK